MWYFPFLVADVEVREVDNIPMEELFSDSHGDGSVTSSSDITSISLGTALDLKLAS